MTTSDPNLSRVPDAIDARRLAAMRFVARMRDSATAQGAGFIGGFIDPVTGERFLSSNLDEIPEHMRRMINELPAPGIPPWDDPLE